MPQFYEPTLEVLKGVGLAQRRLMPGPRKWITKDQILTLSAWGGFIWDLQSLHNAALAAEHRLVVSGTCFRDGSMMKEINAFKSRADTYTFLTHRESKWVDGGIIAGLTQADKEIKRRGANASAITIAADIARKVGGGRRKSQ